jgi:hypothetical protein
MREPHFDCAECLLPVLKRIGTNRFVIREHSIVFTGSDGIRREAPIGMFTDGGSIMWLIEPIAGDPIDSPALPGFLVHDADYQSAPASDASFWRANQSPLRRAADGRLKEACAVLNLAWWRRQAIYHGVRIGGWRAWMLHARDKVGQSRGEAAEL